MKMKSKIIGLRDKVVRHRKRYYCTLCKKHHGKAAIQKWQKHRAFAGEEPDATK